MIAKSVVHDDTSKPPPAKRSLFNKPAWSRPSSSGTSNLFHRSDQTYIASAAEAERERKRNLAKKEQGVVRQETVESRSPKRRRMSDHHGDEDSSNASSPAPPPGEKTIPDLLKSRADDAFAALTSLKPKPSLLDEYESKIAQRNSRDGKQKAHISNVIDLDEVEASPTLPSQEPDADLELVEVPAPEEEEHFEDEEFPELARKAREKARRKRLEEGKTATNPKSLDSAEQYLPTTTPPPPEPDPALQILITSSIANTQPLIVKRKLSQRFKEVRLAWTEKQGFTPEFSDRIFLTWKGKRLFDVTSCKSLGIAVDANGHVSSKGDMMGDADGKIHMEAMTAEILEAYKKGKRNPSGQEAEQAVADEAPTEGQKPTDEVRIILKAREYEEFKLKVKPV